MNTRFNRRDFIKNSIVLGSVSMISPLSGFTQDSEKIPYIDGLTFIPRDLNSLDDSGLTAIIADVSSGEIVINNDKSQSFKRTFEACLNSISAARKRLRNNKNQIVLARQGSDIGKAFKNGKTAVFFQFQGGGEPIEDKLSRIDIFYELGLRILQVTHHYNNLLGGGALEKNPIGLTELGFSAIEYMNNIGIIPDISHASHLCALDVIKTSTNPVILSHSAARAIVNNARCAPDEVIRALAESGGVMGIFMMSFWLTNDPVPTIDHLIKQIKHIINIGGIDSVGISNDYSISGEPNLAKINNNNEEGVKLYHPWWKSIKEKGVLGYEELPKHVVIPELNNIKRMYIIHQALEYNNFTAREIEKIMGGNWTRVLRETLS